MTISSLVSLQRAALFFQAEVLLVVPGAYRRNSLDAVF